MTEEKRATLSYILEDGVSVKRWKQGRPLCIFEGKKRVYRPDQEEYELLKRCDGSKPVDRSPVTDRLEAMRIIRRCTPGREKLSPDRIAEYPNYVIRTVDWAITDRCNYNCRHCFHAMDNSIRRDEFSYGEAMRFLDGIKACGASKVSLSGGEPTLYPWLREVIQGLRDRGIGLDFLITNGSMLTPELLSFIKEMHPKARIDMLPN